MYFKFFNLHSWGKRSAVRRRRMNQRFLKYKTQGAPPQSATYVDSLPPFSKEIKNRSIPFVVSSCNRAKTFPTAALSTSGIRVEGCTFLSACQHKLPCVFSCKIKTGDTLGDASCKKSLCMTSYGGIIRIRYRVEVRLLPLSLQTQAPLYLFR